MVGLVGRAELDGLAQSFAHAESDTPSGLDPDRLTRVRVSSDASLAGFHLERAEAGDGHAVVFAEAFLDAGEHRVDQSRSP